MSEEYENDYNRRLRKYNESLEKMYIDLEENGIIILSSLKVELECEVLNVLEMNKVEMRKEVVIYLIETLNKLKE